MRAMILRKPGGLDKLEPAELADIGTPGVGEIAVRLRASSLNYHDYLVVNGTIKCPDGRIPMSDGAGEVLAVGSGVTDFAVGDLVVSTFFPKWLAGPPRLSDTTDVPGDDADGYAREAVIAPATSFTLAPRGYTAREAASIACAGLTAWRALVPNGRIMAGEAVLVQGTGGVSIFALQFAKMMGATVVATSSSDEKLERLKALGADHVINYRSDPAWGTQAYKLTGGVDHVVEIGGSGTMLQSIAACAPGGHISVIGVLAEGVSSLPTVLLLQKQIRLEGLTVGTRQQQQAMVRAIDVGGLRPVLDQAFPLEALADAFRYQESGAHFGKICIDI